MSGISVLSAFSTITYKAEDKKQNGTYRSNIEAQKINLAEKWDSVFHTGILSGYFSLIREDSA